MALIKCSECNNEVSDKAAFCPKCGNPINISKTVKVHFPTGGGLLAQGCYVYNENDEELAKCKCGETVEFKIDEPTNIYVKMSSYFGKAEILAEPGCSYRVNVRAFGSIAISKVDNII